MRQKQAASATPRSDRFSRIWAIIEATKTFPVLIVVTSATQSDDTDSIARGLAEAAQGAGQRTGYLRLAAAGTEKSNGSYARLSISPRGSQREAFDVALSSWRTMCDVIVVDVGNFGLGALSAHALRVADGVVIGICDERRVTASDRELATLLFELSASVIGVVMTAPPAAPLVALMVLDRSRLEPATQLK